ncbi:MAG TPA: glycosyltransferase family 2 protein, partial [Nocardioidaceae bacterium]|nr:glycosyltransferase family 2 protein [Nocardioidaceae bacterium]
MTVTALLISHNGARWLPAVLEGLGAQTRAPERILAVDTGSGDASVELLTAHLGAESVVGAPARTSFPDAVDLGLEHLPRTMPTRLETAHGEHRPGPAGDVEDTEWIWLLHDDSRPAPDALERLLEVATTNPSVSILGTKHRE